MKKEEIINELAKERTIEKIVQNVAKSNEDTLQDLVQDLYLELLTKKPDSMIEKMYEKGELNYFITKMVLNNIFSSTSPYYKKYKEFLLNDDIDGYKDKI